MKKLPVITVEEWMEAEGLLKQQNPQPEGSITAEQYAKMRKVCTRRAGQILYELSKANLARRDKWGNCWVYWLRK